MKRFYKSGSETCCTDIDLWESKTGDSPSQTIPKIIFQSGGQSYHPLFETNREFKNVFDCL